MKNTEIKSPSLFGLSDTIESASIVVVPVPWDLTTTYHHGTSDGPKAIQKASYQLDLTHPWKGQVWKHGIAMGTFPKTLKEENDRLRSSATQALQAVEEGYSLASISDSLDKMNTACESVIHHVYTETSALLSQSKHVIILGGEHGVGIGYYKALEEKYLGFGILQIDAHMDLRESYLGMTYSHASCMHHALQMSAIERIIQVGIRDYSEDEWTHTKRDDKKVIAYTDFDINNHNKEVGVGGYDFAEIITQLPSKVFISIDIDGLDPSLCPHTGTPVPGGLSYHHLQSLLYQLDQSGKHIIGSELVEVAPGPTGDDWDANVGARILYLLCGLFH